MRQDAKMTTGNERFGGELAERMTCRGPTLVTVIIYLSGIKNKCYSIQAVKRDIHSTYIHVIQGKTEYCYTERQN